MFKLGFGLTSLPIQTVLAQTRVSSLYMGADSTVAVSPIVEQKSIAKFTVVTHTLAGPQFALPCACCLGYAFL